MRSIYGVFVALLLMAAAAIGAVSVSAAPDQQNVGFPATALQDLNLRAGPGPNWQRLGVVYGGQSVLIEGHSLGSLWVRGITQSGQIGWMSGDLLSITPRQIRQLPAVNTFTPFSLNQAPVQPTPIAGVPPVVGVPVPGVNLLQDPGFEGAYTGRGRSDFNIPAPWGVWFTEQPRSFSWQNLPPVAFPHRTAPQIHSGSLSLNMNKGFATFTASVFQQVSVPVGVRVQANAWSFLHVCEDPGDSTPDPCGSDASSGARVRIGIDPNGGSDPYSPEVVWSNFIAPHDFWGQMAIETISTGPAVTVFLFVTQDQPRAFNDVYFDSSSLVIF